MRYRRARLLPIAAALLAALLIAACGGSSKSSSSGAASGSTGSSGTSSSASSSSASSGTSGSTGTSGASGSSGASAKPTNPSSAGTPAKGGNVTILEVAGGVDSLDPGYWYYQTDYTDLGQTTERTLYGFGPTDKEPKPDLAAALPVVSGGGKTLTIKLRPNIHYSAPLANKTVSSADIKYAMERCFLASVGNGYAPVYYGDIVGAPAAPTDKLPNITGLQTPDPLTLVIKTKVPVGVLADANALALPCTVPVPESYASKYDKGATSTYGQHLVFVGPYMISGAGSGTVPGTGYQPSKLLSLVRNPSWNQSTDTIRHAYFNSITFKGGNDVTVASRQVIQGQSLMSGDFAAPPAAVLKQGLTTSAKSQFLVSPSGGNRYIALNTTIPPLNNVNFRRAIAAVIDRNALRLTRGGPAIGTIATHFIPPGMPGFDAAGGTAGDGYDFFANPNGNVQLAESYLKKAGYPSGKYTGPPLLTIADNQAPASNTAEAVEQQLGQIGIKLTFREVPHSTLLSKFCLVPKAKVAICPTLGWGKDFFDSQSMIDPVFNGKNIVQSGNTNVAQVNVPAYNKQMDAAEQLTDPDQRANAWAALDKVLTGQVYYIVWLWDNEVSFASKNVHGVQWAFNGNDWDLTNSWMSS